MCQTLRISDILDEKAIQPSANNVNNNSTFNTKSVPYLTNSQWICPNCSSMNHVQSTICHRCQKYPNMSTWQHIANAISHELYVPISNALMTIIKKHRVPDEDIHKPERVKEMLQLLSRRPNISNKEIAYINDLIKRALQYVAPIMTIPETSRSHMTMIDVLKLKIGDKIDHRDEDGKFIMATIKRKYNGASSVLIEYDRSERQWQVSDFLRELFRFAKAGKISRRPAHRFQHLKIGDAIDINPIHTIHSGRKSGIIQTLDHQSGQVLVSYGDLDDSLLYWSHLDNELEIMPAGVYIIQF